MNNIGLDKFKIIKIDESDLYQNKSSECKFCNRNYLSIGVFDICNHYLCTECIDSLYDEKKNNLNKEDKEDEELFLCPVCGKGVKDIEYR